MCGLEKKVPRRVLQQIAKQYNTTSCLTVSTSKVDIGGFLKPGGTGLISMGNCNGLILEKGVDKWNMGRWSYTLMGSPNITTTVLFVVGYRTGIQTGIPGEKTAWSQQLTMLRKEGRTENPREAFLSDLAQWLRQYRTEGMEIFLSLDANEQWGENAEITKFANSFDLKNINQEFNLASTHPNIANIQQSTTIDFCLCSLNILEHVQYASSAPYELETLGYHRGFIVDIDITRLLGKQDTDKELS